MRESAPSVQTLGTALFLSSLRTSYDPATNGSTIRESAVTRRNPVSTTPDFGGWCARAAPHQPPNHKKKEKQTRRESLAPARDSRGFVFLSLVFLCANRPDSRVRKPQVFLTRFSDPSETPRKTPDFTPLLHTSPRTPRKSVSLCRDPEFHV